MLAQNIPWVLNSLSHFNSGYSLGWGIVWIVTSGISGVLHVKTISYASPDLSGVFHDKMMPYRRKETAAGLSLVYITVG